MKTSKSIFIYLMLLFAGVSFQSQTVSAGQEGNAGQVIYCQKDTLQSGQQLYPDDGYYMLYYVEANQLNVLKDFQGWREISGNDLIMSSDFAIENLDYFAGEYFPSEIKKFLDYIQKRDLSVSDNIHSTHFSLASELEKTWVRTNYNLRKTESTTFELPHNCHLPFIQVVTEKDNKYIVNSEILKQMKEFQILLLYTHEILRIAFSKSDDVIGWTQILHSSLVNQKFCNYPIINNCIHRSDILQVIIDKTKLIDNKRLAARQYRKSMELIHMDLQSLMRKAYQLIESGGEQEMRKKLDGLVFELSMVEDKFKCLTMSEQLPKLSSFKEESRMQIKAFEILKNDFESKWINAPQSDDLEKQNAKEWVADYLDYSVHQLTRFIQNVVKQEAVLIRELKSCPNSK